MNALYETSPPAEDKDQQGIRKQQPKRADYAKRKLLSIKIVQITTHRDGTIAGLGSDGKVYLWSWADGVWHKFWSQAV